MVVCTVHAAWPAVHAAAAAAAAALACLQCTPVEAIGPPFLPLLQQHSEAGAVAHAVDLLEGVDGIAPAAAAGRRHILRSQMNNASAAAAAAAVSVAAAA